MKVFAFVQVLLYVGMLLLFIYCIGETWHFNIASLTFYYGALIIGPVQYFSGLVQLFIYRTYQPLKIYFAIATIILIAEGVLFLSHAGHAWQFMHTVMVISGLMLGLYYIHICVRISRL